MLKTFPFRVAPLFLLLLGPSVRVMSNELGIKNTTKHTFIPVNSRRRTVMNVFDLTCKFAISSWRTVPSERASHESVSPCKRCTIADRIIANRNQMNIVRTTFLNE